MSEMTLEEASKAIKLLSDGINHMCPDLEYTLEQVSDTKKSQEYYKTWKKGLYSIDSLTNFINARCSYLYSKTSIGKKAINNRLDLLDYLFKKESKFEKEIYKIRKSLGLGNDYEKTEFANAGEGLDAISRQYEHTSKEKVDKKYHKKTVEVITEFQKEFNLADEWYDVLLCQIASPKVQQRTMVRNMRLIQKISIIEAYGGVLTVRLWTSDLKNEEIKVLKEVIKGLAERSSRNEFVDIDDMIADDRAKGLSWRELSKKYSMSADNIRQRIYYNSKEK